MFHKKAWNTQFTQRSLAIETHLLTARFPQRSLSQSYQKRFAQNNPAKTNFLPPSAKPFSAPAQPLRYTQIAESTPNPISKRTSLYSQPPRHTDNKITSTLSTR